MVVELGCQISGSTIETEGSGRKDKPNSKLNLRLLIALLTDAVGWLRRAYDTGAQVRKQLGHMTHLQRLV